MQRQGSMRRRPRAVPLFGCATPLFDDTESREMLRNADSRVRRELAGPSLFRRERRRVG